MAVVVHVSPKGHHLLVMGSNSLHLGRRKRLFVSCAEEGFFVVKIVGFGLNFLFYEPVVVLNELVASVSLIEGMVSFRWVIDPYWSSIINR